MRKTVTFFILFFAIIGGLSNLYAQMEQPQLTRKNPGMLLRTNNQLELRSLSEMQTTISPAKKHSPDYLKTKSLIPLNDSIYNWKWDTLTNGWAIDPLYKTINIVYDASNNLISYIRQIWDSGAWVNYEQLTYIYDANNNKTNGLYEYWDGSSWVNGEIDIYSFDANNNETSLIIQVWNGSMWGNYYQYIYTYDGNNNLINRLTQNWNGSTWVNCWQTNYTFDANNNMTSLLNLNWIANTWVNNYQYISISYDANNNMISRLSQNWNGSAWVDNVYGTYTYDINNNLTDGFEVSWNGSTWMNNWQFADTYDVNNNQTSEIGQSWNDTAWVNVYLTTYAYDANNFEIINTYKSWNDAGAKVTDGDSIYNYFHTVTGINDLSAQGKSIIIYPNPAKDMVTLNIENAGSEDPALNIYNVSGVLVRSEMLKQHQQQINISDLNNGIYIVEIKTNNMAKKLKLIIQR